MQYLSYPGTNLVFNGISKNKLELFPNIFALRPCRGVDKFTGLQKRRGGKNKTRGVLHFEGIVFDFYSIKTAICNNVDLTR